MRDSKGRFIEGSEPLTKKKGQNKNCIRCGKEFYVKLAKIKLGWDKYCSLKCKNTPTFIRCIICQKEFKVKPREVNIRKTCSYNCRNIIVAKTYIPYWKNKKRPNLAGKKNVAWKDEKVSYAGLHQWIKREKGKPIFCSMKDFTCKGSFEWANISHEYKRDTDDFMSLCKSHHAKYDKKA